MPAVIRQLFSMLLAGVFALALLGTAPPAALCADAGCDEMQDNRGDGGAPPAADGGADDAAPALMADAVIMLLPAARVAAATTGPSQWASCPGYPAHWPQAPPA